MFSIRSSAFENGGLIPRRYTGDGENISPPLEFIGIPESARELVVICDDPDAPQEDPFVHWVLYGLSSQVRRIAESLPRQSTLHYPIRCKQGLNSFDQIGYGGPHPPPTHTYHRYYFKLYALGRRMGLQGGLTKNEVLSAFKGHIVGSCELVGRYERKLQAG